jgi:hypothetical protein
MVCTLTDDERPLVFYGDGQPGEGAAKTTPPEKSPK